MLTAVKTWSKMMESNHRYLHIRQVSYQLDESSFLLENAGGLLLEGGANTRALVGMARVELAASSL
jgi:hypothetical protein